MRLRIRYDLDDIQLLAAVAAFLLYMAFLAAVGPWLFPVGVMGEGR